MRRAEPKQVSIRDEPLPHGSEVDWLIALDLALHRRDSERDRLDRIEGKIAPVIAGTVAALGLFVDKASSPLDFGMGLLLLIPLAMLFNAFRTYVYSDVPNLNELKKTYEWYPKTYVRSVVLGIADAITKNEPTIDGKARQLNRAMTVLYVVLAAILISRATEAGTIERIQKLFTSSPTATAAPKSTATATRHSASTANPGKRAGTSDQGKRVDVGR